MNRKTVVSSLMLTLTAFIWGSAFVAQSVGMESIGPFSFTALRSVIGGLFLFAFILIKDKGLKFPDEQAKKTLFQGSIACGAVLFLGTSFQQHGLLQTSVGKAGFITTLYIIIVPILGIFLKKRVAPKVYFAMALALIGTYFLCMTESFTLNNGDVLLLVGALCFSFHILVVDHFSKVTDGVQLGCFQLLVCAVFAGIPTLILETTRLAMIKQALIPLLYAGVISSGVAFTMQIVAQKNINPVIASLLMSLESVFSVLAGWVILGQVLTKREVLGCILVFIAVITAQIPAFPWHKKTSATFTDKLE